MPVVSRENVRLFDEEAKKRSWNYGKNCFMKIIKYTSKTELFTIELPDYMQGVLGTSSVNGLTQGDVNKVFKQAIREYNLRIISKKKVIIYALMGNVHEEIDGEVFNMESLGLYGNEGKNSSGLAIWYEVCWETKAEQGRKFFDFDGFSVKPSGYRLHWDVMDYSPEREAFFETLSHEIAVLAFNARSFLIQKELPQIIDHSRALPFLKKGDDE